MVSSRTPEGLPNQCPVCGKEVRMDPSVPFGDAPCPHCGYLLFYIQQDDSTLLWDLPAESAAWRRILQMLSERWDVPVSRLQSHRVWETMDSLDLVEAVMELEDEFGRK